MSERIPANARAYMKGVRANKQKQKQKQSNKQTTTVIINQEPKRRRGPNKPKSAPASGGGGGGPSVIPYVIPQTQLTAASYQNSAVQPPSEIQQLTQALNQFQATPVYRNPFRMEPFRTAMNPTPLQNEEIPLAQPVPSPPPPEMPNIVLQPNFLRQLSAEPQLDTIYPSSSSYQGFTQLDQVNQLNQDIDREINAYDDFGGYDAQTQPEYALSRGLEQTDNELRNKLRMVQEESMLNNYNLSLNPIVGGGGGLSFESDTSSVAPKQNKGRPFTELTPLQQHGIELYINARENMLIGNRSFLNSLNQRDREAYNTGRLMVTQNKKNNPNVIAFIKTIEDKYK